MTNEIWKTIPSFPFYKASNEGNIKRFIYKRADSVPRSPRFFGVDDPKAYLHASLVTELNTVKTGYAHKLVCEAWHENPEGKPCVNHKDNNRKNNRPDNLEWVTHKENKKHYVRWNKRLKAVDLIKECIENGQLYLILNELNEEEKNIIKKEL